MISKVRSIEKEKITSRNKSVEYEENIINRTKN